MRLIAARWWRCPCPCTQWHSRAIRGLPGFAHHSRPARRQGRQPARLHAHPDRAALTSLATSPASAPVRLWRRCVPGRHPRGLDVKLRPGIRDWSRALVSLRAAAARQWQRQPGSGRPAAAAAAGQRCSDRAGSCDSVGPQALFPRRFGVSAVVARGRGTAVRGQRCRHFRRQTRIGFVRPGGTTPVPTWCRCVRGS
jgi:hypothetical protein